MARLGIAAHDVLVIEGALDADSVRRLVDFLGQRLGSGKAEDVIDAVIFTPGHRLGPRIVPIAAKQDASGRPRFADMSGQPAQMRSHLDAGRKRRFQATASSGIFLM